MNEVIVLGDGAKPPARISGDETVLRLETSGNSPNVRLHIDIFPRRFLRDLPERLDDLLRLAAFVYSADTRVSRGSRKDVFGNKWSRMFRMILPVWDLEFWKSSAVQEMLAETLQSLTGDKYSFEFVQRTSDVPQQGILNFKQPFSPFPHVDLIVLFSGGTDSLAAVLEAIDEDRHPILVSHRSAPTINSRQKNLVNLLGSRFTGWTFPHISMWVNRAGGGRTVEFSQRSRAFLFVSLGVVTAALLDIDEVRLCDNGIMSINLPQSGQNIGTFLSRSTHPRFISLAERLMHAVTKQDGIRIRNTLLFKTKKEVLELIANSGHPELIQECVSCTHVEGKTKFQPHCGVCTQCIDRRFASVAAGLADHDLSSRYEKDIFVDALDEGEERTHAENYVRFAMRLEAIQSPDHFFESFPELFDCLPKEGDVDGFAQSLWNLFQRHQQTVNEVVERQIKTYSQDIRRAVLPTNSLLRIVATGQHTIDFRIRYVDRLRSLICRSLPAAFQTQEAKNERHVQDIGESVFQAAQEHLQRESPQIPFGVVSTKPDFADIPSNMVPLFLEFKYVKKRERLNAIITEMTSRVTIYSDQGAWILFVIYDPGRSITNDEKFADAFEKHDGVFVGIAR
jgi:hypothetical protein